MIDKIRAYIDHAFASAPPTQKVQELKEELFANLVEKYNEQLNQGRTENEAYNIVINGIGDLSELVHSVCVPFGQPTNQQRRRHAFFVSCAVALYIISPFMVVLFEMFGREEIGVLLMFVLIAVATGLLIFNRMTRPVYVKADETMVEDFKEWRTAGRRAPNAFGAFRRAYWTLVTVIYLAVSFIFQIWHFSWLIFLIGAAVDQIFQGIMRLREE